MLPMGASLWSLESGFMLLACIHPPRFGFMVRSNTPGVLAKPGVFVGKRPPRKPGVLPKRNILEMPGVLAGILPSFPMGVKPGDKWNDGRLAGFLAVWKFMVFLTLRSSSAHKAKAACISARVLRGGAPRGSASCA